MSRLTTALARQFAPVPLWLVPVLLLVVALFCYLVLGLGDIPNVRRGV